MRKRRGQSILEYVIIFAAIIAAVIFASTQFIRPAVEKGMEDTSGAMKGATGRLATMPGTGGGGE